MSLEGTIAANRFGLGARPGDIEKISADPKGWLLSQLKPEQALPTPLSALPSTLDDQTLFYKWLAQVFQKGRKAGINLYNVKPGQIIDGPKQAPDDMVSAGMASPMDAQSGMDGGLTLKGGTSTGNALYDNAMGGSADDKKGLSIEAEYGKTFVPRYAEALKARLDTAIQTETPFFERLVHFWVNHFVVSAVKPGGTSMPPSFERDAIRPNVMGNFRDMLMASSKHPAMLFYLDNFASIGPNSKVGLNPFQFQTPGAFGQGRKQRKVGINENLAREIMELQTLGVRSGYTQADVTSFAKVITGWTTTVPIHVAKVLPLLKGGLAGVTAKDLFYFDPDWHEPGPQTIMGKVYAQAGVDQGEAVLDDLAHHPATAHFIATKLVRHFIADEPPKAAVDRVAKVFRDSNGDLVKVYTALVTSAEAFSTPLAKFKTPDEFLISTARALPGFKLDSNAVFGSYAQLGQTPYGPSGPNGWPDVASEWMGSDAIWKRFEWSNVIAHAVATSGVDPATLATEAMGATLSPETMTAIQRAQSPAQGVTLMLASVEFQRR